jgi:hypothetical protein
VLRLTFVTHRATVQSIIQKAPLTLAFFKNEFAGMTTVPVTAVESCAELSRGGLRGGFPELEAELVCVSIRCDLA